MMLSWLCWLFAGLQVAVIASSAQPAGEHCQASAPAAPVPRDGVSMEVASEEASALSLLQTSIPDVTKRRSTPPADLASAGNGVQEVFALASSGGDADLTSHGAGGVDPVYPKERNVMLLQILRAQVKTMTRMGSPINEILVLSAVALALLWVFYCRYPRPTVDEKAEYMLPEVTSRVGDSPAADASAATMGTQEVTDDANTRRTSDVSHGTNAAPSGGGGTCCCASGVSSLLRGRQAAAREVEVRSASTKATQTPQATAFAGKSCHPDFSGTWKCVKAEGALDAFFADLGLSFFERTLCASWNWGAGRVVRIYEQSGNSVKLTEKSLAEHQEQWEINGEEQLVNGKQQMLQTAYWDDEDDQVLVLVSKDVEKAKPDSWTTSRQRLLSKDTFVIESTSTRGNAASWTYVRDGCSS
eukprot:TRINITY_DN18396_c0_g1_i1.p1 TRINITY_DN18396_c0_g1~~TRINITY_DN18396_c0_g1_i1.p1  ORF type:complete len:415 (+),score=83.33 TRINITY_DN18396_c0_g1_i1:86-1330(+)